MDTNNLRYFAAVAQYGSITRAARAMYISQPQLSHIIKQLEKEMGLTLFRRTSQGTRLTLDGQRILAHSKVILREMDQLRHLSTARKQDCGCLNVSMTRFPIPPNVSTKSAGATRMRKAFPTTCAKPPPWM